MLPLPAPSRAPEQPDPASASMAWLQRQTPSLTPCGLRCAAQCFSHGLAVPSRVMQALAVLFLFAAGSGCSRDRDRDSRRRSCRADDGQTPRKACDATLTRRAERGGQVPEHWRLQAFCVRQCVSTSARCRTWRDQAQHAFAEQELSRTCPAAPLPSAHTPGHCPGHTTTENGGVQ